VTNRLTDLFSIPESKIKGCCPERFLETADDGGNVFVYILLVMRLQLYTTNN